MSKTQDAYFVRSDRIINDLSTAPQDSLQGIVLLYPHICLLPIGNTVVRKDYTEMSTFRILSGGPSGHEPMYSGYVGRGMLTAAIQGDIFASPTTFEILNVIRELAFNQNWGVFLIIQNSSNSVLNFARAVEKALTEGISVKCLITTDDCSIPVNAFKSDQPQGLTGSIITAKVAGAMADGFGYCLPEVHEFCSELQKQMTTVLLVLKSCSLMTTSKCACLELNDINIGGSLIAPGKHKLKCLSASYVVEEMMKELTKNIILDAGAEIIVMINNMCCSTLEENIFTCELLKKLIAMNVTVMRIYVGTFMTAIDLQGFTVTVIKSSDLLLNFIDYETNAPSWKMRTFGVDPCVQRNAQIRIQVTNYPKLQLQGPSLTPRESNILVIIITFACDAIMSCRKQLDIMDSERGSGDLGLRLESVGSAILKSLRENKLNTSNMFAFFKMLSKICDNISGSIAAIYSIIFESCANTFSNIDMSDNPQINYQMWIDCLENAVISLKTYTKNEDSSFNMLSPLMVCAATLAEKMSLDGYKFLNAFERAVAKAEEAARNAIYAGWKYPDPGAHAVGIWLRAVYEGVKFRCQF